jgi:hypothetical protein
MQFIYSFISSNVITILPKALKSHVHNIRFTSMSMFYGYKIGFLTLSQPHMRVFESRVMRDVLGHRKENVERN